MRHHGDVSISLAKFIYTILVAVGSGAFALFRYLEGQTYQYVVVGSIILFSLVIGKVFLLLMVRNRIYFVIVARQVNSIRNYLLNNMEMDFLKYNKCYLDPHVPKALNPWSSYLTLLLILSLINGLLGGLGYYFIINYFIEASFWAGWIFSLIVGITVAMSHIAIVCYSLYKQDR